MKGGARMSNHALVVGEPNIKVGFNNPMTYVMNGGNIDKYIKRLLPLPGGIKILKDNLTIERL